MPAGGLVRGLGAEGSGGGCDRKGAGDAMQRSVVRAGGRQPRRAVRGPAAGGGPARLGAGCVDQAVPAAAEVRRAAGAGHGDAPERVRLRLAPGGIGQAAGSDRVAPVVLGNAGRVGAGRVPAGRRRAADPERPGADRVDPPPPRRPPRLQPRSPDQTLLLCLQTRRPQPQCQRVWGVRQNTEKAEPANPEGMGACPP